MNPLYGLFLVCLICVSYGQEFVIPQVILEAYEPAGLRASIPVKPGIERFVFHGRINKPLSQIEPGDFSEEVTKPIDDFFTYYNPSLKLTQGDVVHYWVFVQQNKLGYRRDGLKWVVKELKKEDSTGCALSATKVSNSTKVCKDSTVFEDNFDLTTLDETKWTLEQYIPAAPDFLFVKYKKDKDVTFVKNKKLCIKPKLITDEGALRKNVDLSNGCTKPPSANANCEVRYYIHSIQNPVVSGKVTSKMEFTYGKFEIRARLPSGDWIIPEVYLEDENLRKILIAYSRGNLHLTGNDGDDIGGSLLFGGPVSNHTEPARSSKLNTYRHSSGPLSGGVHTYTLIWTPNKIELYIDGNKYGPTIQTEAGFTGQDAAKFRLVLGIGVGGTIDFPDGYKSGDNNKPWQNYHTKQVKEFYMSRNIWYPTWDESGRQLRIEYVKVTAI